jgi:hypothetical protein
MIIISKLVTVYGYSRIGWVSTKYLTTAPAYVFTGRLEDTEKQSRILDGTVY